MGRSCLLRLGGDYRCLQASGSGAGTAGAELPLFTAAHRGAERPPQVAVSR